MFNKSRKKPAERSLPTVLLSTSLSLRGDCRCQGEGVQVEQAGGCASLILCHLWQLVVWGLPLLVTLAISFLVGLDLVNAYCSFSLAPDF